MSLVATRTDSGAALPLPAAGCGDALLAAGELAAAAWSATVELADGLELEFAGALPVVDVGAVCGPDDVDAAGED